jgi:hypothetical protein
MGTRNQPFSGNSNRLLCTQTFLVFEAPLVDSSDDVTVAVLSPGRRSPEIMKAPGMTRPEAPYPSTLLEESTIASDDLGFKTLKVAAAWFSSPEAIADEWWWAMVLTKWLLAISILSVTHGLVAWTLTQCLRSER